MSRKPKLEGGKLKMLWEQRPGWAFKGLSRSQAVLSLSISSSSRAKMEFLFERLCLKMHVKGVEWVVVSCESSKRLIRCTRAQESSTQNTHTIHIYPLLNSEQLCEILEHSGRAGICKDGVEGTYFSESSHLRREGLGGGGLFFVGFFSVKSLIKSSSFFSK